MRVDVGGWAGETWADWVFASPAAGIGLGVHATDATLTDACAGGLRWCPDEPQGQRLEVLHNGGEMELVTSAGETSQPQRLEAVVGLQVREAHLDALV